MTRTMIETDAMAATAGHEGGSRPTKPENAQGPGKLALTCRVDALTRRAQGKLIVNSGTYEMQMLLIEDALALVHDLADQIERITPYLDETDQDDDDRGGTA